MKNTMVLETLDSENWKQNYSEIQKKINDSDKSENFTYQEFLKDVIHISEIDYIFCIRTSLKASKIFLEMKPCEVRINPYMTSLLKIWKANHDLQFVVDQYECVVYTVDFISKSQRGMSL